VSGDGELKEAALTRRSSTQTDGPAARDEEAVRQYIERMARLFADWGFPRMSARVLFVLMTADEPSLTAGDLAARLEVSPAAISGAVRYLSQLDLVERAGVPGSRRDVYRLRDHTWYAGAGSTMQFYKLLIAAADDVLGPLGGADTMAGERVAEMRDFFVFLSTGMPRLLEEWQATRAAKEPAGDSEG
jgi:DNA-binding transcriptional ArsR family regulator